jgi:photosystem II stability/assembly factor-like uncharacterized protein
MLKKALICSALFMTVAATANAQQGDAPEPGFNAETFAGLQWRGIGPALMSGRISDIEVDPRNPAVWYVAAGSGGVWKTANRGTTWTSLFDGQGSYSIGDIAIDPSAPDTLWVGSGENVGGRHVAYGDGVYRSRDGGQTWQNMGLENSEHIGMVLVDPRDSNTVFVAAQGPLWSAGGDRGLFRSTDGGENWEKVLGGNEYTGVTEVHLDPRNPDVMYAATHQRLRNVAALINGGPDSGIHKSTDGGRTWRELGTGLPQENMGKIGLAVSPVNPDVVYATIELAQRRVAFYRSQNAGESWEKRSEYVSDSTGPHYYIELFASPHNVDHVYEMDNTLRFTDDGGATLQRLQTNAVHSDFHALAFDTGNPDYLLHGTDGGLYESWDGGQTHRFIDNLPVTQFYKVAVDYDLPFYNLYGGTQDNTTQGGPSRTDNVHGIRNQDWFLTLFGDGHQPAVNPDNPDIVYSEWQEGNLVRYDRKNGEIVYIQPQPGADEPGERFNWDAPILISPHDSARLYFASQRLWRSDDHGDSWRPVSGDLTRQVNRLVQPMMGQVWAYESSWDLRAMSKFGTITSVSESPVVEGLLYVGTDDGRIQVSENGGDNWRAIDRLPGVPGGFFVNDIKADLHDADTVYVVIDNHKAGDLQPYVLKSSNRGRSWDSISGNLPERHLVWRLVQDHVKPELLFVGTEFGVFFSVTGGNNWTKLSGAAPTISFRDLAIQQRENDLVGATFGRGFYILDDYTPLRTVSNETLQNEATLFEVRPAPWYIPRRPLAFPQAGNQAMMGDDYFIAPNPEFGALFTYYLKDGFKSAREQRIERERKANAAGEDAPFQGFDSLLEEAAEDAPALLFTVRDSDGELVRIIEAPATAGFNRVAWDLRYADSAPWSPGGGGSYIPIPGPLAAPGSYTVSMSKRIDGNLVELAGPVPFEVSDIREATLEGAPPAEVTAFALRLDRLQGEVAGAGKAVETAMQEVAAIKETLVRSTAPLFLRNHAHNIEERLRAVALVLDGDPERDKMNAPGTVPLAERLGAASIGTAFSAYGPTPTLARNVDIAEQGFEQIRPELNKLFRQDLPDLRSKLDAANVPWTPGRSVSEG